MLIMFIANFLLASLIITIYTVKYFITLDNTIVNSDLGEGALVQCTNNTLYSKVPVEPQRSEHSMLLK